MSWMKEQGKNLQNQINEEEIGNLPKTEFRVMLVKMIRISEIEWRQELTKYKKCLTNI